MSEHAYKISICSTNNSSSDEEDFRSLKLSSDFSPLSALSRRPRSFSANRSESDSNSLVIKTAEENQAPCSRRRASFSLDNHTSSIHCKPLPSALLELSLQDKARDSIIGNRFLDDIALLTKPFKDCLPRSDLETQVIPEEIEGKEDLDLHPVPIIKDKLEEAIVPTHRNIIDVHEPIKEETEEDNEYIKLRHEETKGIFEKDKIEEAIAPIYRGTSEVHESIKEEGEEEQDVVIRHTEINRFLEKDKVEEAIAPIYRGTSEVHESIKEEGEEEQDVVIRHTEINRFLEKDKVEEAYLANQRSIPDHHETINEEYEDEQERVVLRLDDRTRCIDKAEAPSPKNSMISGVPESITEEEEEDNEIQLRHDEFWDKIVQKDCFYYLSEEHRSSQLQEVMEETEESTGQKVSRLE